MSKNLFIAIFLIAWTATASAGGLLMLRVGSSDGTASGPVVPCDQTGLDFTLNCNMVFIPALIYH